MSRNIQKKSKEKAARKVGAGTGPVTVEALVAQAALALSNVQPELASKFYKKALTLQPQDTGLMDATADALIQTGDAEEALQYLRKSTALQPDANPCKWMFMGQLLTGIDAHSCYLTGIEKLKAHVRLHPGEVRAMCCDFTECLLCW